MMTLSEATRVSAARNVFRPRKQQLTVLTWHIHGSYLNYLAYSGHDFVVPVREGRPSRFGGRPADATWPANVREVPAEQLSGMDFDAILYQHADNWTEDRVRWLTDRQLTSIPQAFLEHNPPRQHPSDTCHVVDDAEVPVVHVTHFNRLMWDCGRSPSTTIEHGVTVPDDAVWGGRKHAGVAVVNDIASRGRRLGSDVFEQMRGQVPVELIGRRSGDVGGLGEMPHHLVPYAVGTYRFFLNPIRYTSLGLAVCEAMMVGAPVIGLATTEMSVVIDSGVNGFVDTDVDRLADHAQVLLDDHGLAACLSQNARETARERYGIERFARHWDEFLGELVA